MKRVPSVVLLIACVVSAVRPGVADTIRTFGGTATLGQHQRTLVEIDLASGSTAALPLGATNYWTGLDFAPSGTTLYGVNSSLFAIDPNTGAPTLIGPLMHGSNGPLLMSCATVSPTGDIYMRYSGAGAPRIFRANPLTAALTLIGGLPSDVFALEFADDGTLYAAGTNLYVLDAATGGVTKNFGAIGGSGPINELDFSPSGQLLGVNNYTPGFNLSRIYAINPQGTPGALATLVCNTTTDDLRSIASVPEASSLAAAAIGLTCVLRRREIRQRA